MWLSCSDVEANFPLPQARRKIGSEALHVATACKQEAFPCMEMTGIFILLQTRFIVFCGMTKSEKTFSAETIEHHTVMPVWQASLCGLAKWKLQWLFPN